MTWLDVDQLTTALGGFRRDLFRLETLPEYAVDSDGEDFRRWLAGEPEPTWERKNPWLQVLRRDRAAHKTRRRVRVFSQDITDYEKYEAGWGYTLNAKAGEIIRVLRRGEHRIPAVVPNQDFWLVDDNQVIVMHYDDHGRFEAGEVLPPAATGPYKAAHDAAWTSSEPFLSWWARHPELHRRVAV